MKINIIYESLKNLSVAAMCVASAVFSSSCDRIHEDLQPCDQGLRIRFIYDYNMEFANAFPSQVDCLTVLFYDEQGNYVTTQTNTTSSLSDENWRMTVNLDPGKYTVLAYGGMECPETSFSFVTPPSTTPLHDLEVRLDPDKISTELHPLFYGRLETSVEENALTYKEVTVEMMKDTNNLRILLQQIDGDPVDCDDYDFRVIDNNTLFSWDNNLLPVPTVNYLPWTTGNASPGELPDGSDASVAWAEISFSRLVTAASPRLQITHIETGKKVVDIPLNNYLLLLKSEVFATMPNQQFLDRESRWNMIFFLSKDNYWISTMISVKDWNVRINNTEV